MQLSDFTIVHARNAVAKFWALGTRALTTLSNLAGRPIRGLTYAIDVLIR